MRRTDRAITDPAEMRAILEKADACHLALAQDNEPYLVTMNFGLKPGEPLVIYFHAAHEGKKIAWLRRNPTVCFGADVDHALLLSPTGTSCGCSMRFRSVVGTGQVAFVTDRAEKEAALTAIMQHYTETAHPAFADEMLARTTILRLDVQAITAKQRP